MEVNTKQTFWGIVPGQKLLIYLVNNFEVEVVPKVPLSEVAYNVQFRIFNSP